MNYVFFALIIASVFFGLVFKRKNTGIVLLLFITIILIGKYPKLSVNAAKDGINLWIFVVMPSLLPFFIINDMLVSLKVPENISRLFAPAAKFLFNTSGYGAYTFVMSVFSGYPAGAKITANLLQSKNITPAEGQKILTFSSTSGPLFLIGVVGASMLGSTGAGYILILAHILGAAANGILFGMILKGKNDYRIISQGSNSNNKSISQILGDAIISSLYTGGLIGGYIILFAVLNSLLNKIEFFKILSSLIHSIMFIPVKASDIISYFLQSSLEISNGSKIIAEMNISIEIKLILLSFIIAFSGLSIIGQVSGIVNKTGLSLALYIISKVCHGIFASLICFVLLKINLFSLEVSKLPEKLPEFYLRTDILLIILLITLLIMNIIGGKRRNSTI